MLKLRFISCFRVQKLTLGSLELNLITSVMTPDVGRTDEASVIVDHLIFNYNSSDASTFLDREFRPKNTDERLST